MLLLTIEMGHDVTGTSKQTGNLHWSAINGFKRRDRVQRNVPPHLAECTVGFV